MMWSLFKGKTINQIFVIPFVLFFICFLYFFIKQYFTFVMSYRYFVEQAHLTPCSFAIFLLKFRKIPKQHPLYVFLSVNSSIFKKTLPFQCFCFCIFSKVPKTYLGEWCACVSFPLPLVQSTVWINMFLFLRPWIQAQRSFVYSVRKGNLEPKCKLSQLQWFVIICNYLLHCYSYS